MSKPLSMFWQALQEVPNWRTERLDWQARLGDEWPAVSRFFRATGRLAKRLSCPYPDGDGCPREIVRHDDEITAVCRARPPKCSRVTVQVSDIEILELDTAALAAAVARELRLQPRTLRQPHPLTSVGSIPVLSGLSAPLFMSLPQAGSTPISARDFPSLLRGEPGALVLVPRNAVIDPIPAGWTSIGLEDLFCIGGDSIVARPEVLGTLESLKSDVGGVAKAGDTAAWRLPAGARWGELVLEFVADEVLKARFRGETRQLEPEHLGCKSRKNGRPTVGWNFLQQLAAQGGRISWKSKGAAWAVKKHKQLLCDNLIACFGIEEDPIPWSKTAKAYVARFILRDSRTVGSRRAG